MASADESVMVMIQEVATKPSNRRTRALPLQLIHEHAGERTGNCAHPDCQYAAASWMLCFGMIVWLLARPDSIFRQLTS